MEGDTNLRRTATLGALASVAIVIGIIVVVWLLFFRDSGSNGSQQNGAQTNQTQQAENNDAQNENPAQSGSGNSNNSTDNRAEEQPKSTTDTDRNTTNDRNTANNGKTDKNGKPLPNTGPRENALVFLGTGLAATGVYYIYTRRKLARG